MGLTRAAETFVSGLDLAAQPEPLHGELGTTFYLHTWRTPEGRLIKEVLQDSPWSSGPLYFTCLIMGWKTPSGCKIYVWVRNPQLSIPVDYDLGHYWV